MTIHLHFSNVHSVAKGCAFCSRYTSSTEHGVLGNFWPGAGGGSSPLAGNPRWISYHNERSRGRGKAIEECQFGQNQASNIL